MRWLFTIVILLAPLASARADEALPSRPVDLALIAALPGEPPVSFDLVDFRAEARVALVPVKVDSTPHTIFQVKQHIGIAGGYDNGSPHGSIGFYITVAEWKRWNLGVPSIEVGVGRYPAYDARLNQAFMKEEFAFFVSMASAHYRAGYIRPWGVHWYVNLEQVFDVHANRAGSQLGISFSRK
jgi:hypothetical protein